MSDLVEALKLLLFLQTILITPERVDIGSNWVTITPESALSAINDGASIRVDVSRQLEPFNWDAANKLFPEGSVEGILRTKDGIEIALVNRGTAHTENSVDLIIAPIESFPLEAEFTQVRLRSINPISAAEIYWKNGSK